MKKIFDTLFLGFALFAIFFGAGNLIFPPSIGHVSGTNWVPALIGFSITGILLPLLAVIAIIFAGGKFEDLTRPISPWFYKVFNLLLMVGVGVFVTIPRMAATTHELGVQTFSNEFPLVITIIIFFGICFYFAMDKSNVIDKIGKILTPLLVIILLFIVGKGIIDPIGTPIVTELINPFSNAFINAYQTGDVITGFFCAPIFIAAILAHGYKGAEMKKVAITGTIIAGLGLFFVYGGLLYLGAVGGGMFPTDIDNTALLSELIHLLLGNTGTLLLALAIALACLTSAIGVIAVIAEFISELTKNKLKYRTAALLICIVSASIGSLGVEKIINYTIWIFSALYPVAIVLVFLGIFRKYIPNQGAYRGTILFTFVISFVETMASLGFTIPGAHLISTLPLSGKGFAWLVPAVSGFVLGAIIHKIVFKKKDNDTPLSPINND
ncbi:branched-chain amino acid transport system II carrier protein [Lysinibacillus sp. BW-2-10]|uniref:branched-chain amino acid transport system II carrier protein n=1 Tax=Lysinibacillus sp. BW-2-10 TaxID=2590030 RepID=UPI00117E7BD7|nr:branched-chain amino acid transport system II carrier protein [Lysinibacillus sp. BW-2-10]TSI04154.1 branched-chain amino acid transport system II carrier protein [Lysinibacillus sp. BW-2-10]